MLLEIEARGYAPKWQVAATGEQRGTIILERGAAIRGRLVDHGKPMANAEVAIVPITRRASEVT